VLKTTGYWSPHEDVALLRSGLPVMFTEEQEQGAAAVADTAMTTDLDEDIRVDLTHLKVFTIDGAGASCSACVRVLRSAESRNLNKGGR